jgi:hypothetical protein
MKRLMTMMLALSFVLGSVAVVFAGHNRHHKDGEKGEEIEEGPREGHQQDGPVVQVPVISRWQAA